MQIPDPLSAKEHYHLFLRVKNRKSVKQLEMITFQPKTFEDSNIVDIKSVVLQKLHINYPRL